MDGGHSEPFRHEESVRLKHSERALNKVQRKLVADLRHKQFCEIITPLQLSVAFSYWFRFCTYTETPIFKKQLSFLQARQPSSIVDILIKATRGVYGIFRYFGNRGNKSHSPSFFVCLYFTSDSGFEGASVNPHGIPASHAGSRSQGTRKCITRAWLVGCHRH